MHCNYYFHLHHQLKNVKVFDTTGMYTMCPGLGSHTSSLPLISYGVKAVSNFRKRIFDGKCFEWSVLYQKYPNIFDIAKICFIIVPKVGYKGRDVKQSIKRGMSKGGCTKGEMGIAILPKNIAKSVGSKKR